LRDDHQRWRERSAFAAAKAACSHSMSAALRAANSSDRARRIAEVVARALHVQRYVGHAFVCPGRFSTYGGACTSWRKCRWPM
jgi:hypothetical protein